MVGSMIKVFLLSYFFSVSLASYEFDLFQVVKISDSSKNIPGVNIIKPTNPGETFSVSFDDKAGKDLTTTSDQYTYITNAFLKSDDVTVSLKLNLDDLTNPNEYCIFALQNTEGSLTYFSIGIQVAVEHTSVEGVTQQKKIVQYVYIRIRLPSSNIVYDYLKLNDMLKPGKASTLVLRFQNKYSDGKRKRRASSQIKRTIASLSVDCKEIDKKVLKVPLTDVPLQGRFALGMVYNPTEITKRFKGIMNSPKILNGAGAFKLLNPCAKVPNQAVPSEPRPSEYDPTYFDEFVKMTSESELPVNLECVEADKTVRFSGEVWRPTECEKYSCYNGKITLKYICLTCKVGDKVILPKETFIDPATPCINKLCRSGRIFDQDSVICKTLNCDSFGEVKVEGECCKKCKSDSCTKKDTVYGEGCERKCSGGGSNSCKSKALGCWCKEGYLLDENNECIPKEKCVCKVDSKVYQPFEYAVKSSCETCVCYSGSLKCMNLCGY